MNNTNYQINDQSNKISTGILLTQPCVSFNQKHDQFIEGIRKEIKRKPTAGTTSYNSKKSSAESKRLMSPRYIITTPLKTNESKQKQLEKSQDPNSSRATQKLYVNQKSLDLGSDSAKSKNIEEDTANYYKYWKKKANQYQDLNFSLHRMNSALQEQNIILRHKIDKLEKKTLKNIQVGPINLYERGKNHEKLENYYLLKLDEMGKKIEQQEKLIEKQQRKIKQLSIYIEQNKQLRLLLDNMEQKIGQMKVFKQCRVSGEKNNPSQLLNLQSYKDTNKKNPVNQSRSVYSLKDSSWERERNEKLRYSNIKR